MWARIEKDVVAEIVSQDPSGRFSPSLIWVECADDTKQGMIYRAGKFEPAPPPDTEWLAAEARSLRDALLRDVYDVGVIRARREERMGADVEARMAALDDYAVALLDVPQQEGFPHAIIWPEAPVDISA